jgi:hypothetical protein
VATFEGRVWRTFRPFSFPDAGSGGRGIGETSFAPFRALLPTDTFSWTFLTSAHGFRERAAFSLKKKSQKQ